MDETITSRKNPLITRMAKLSDKKHRDAEGLFRIDGVKLFSEAVSVGLSVEYVFLSDAKREKLMHELAEPLASCGGRIPLSPNEKHRPTGRCFPLYCVLCVLYKNQLFLFWKHSLQ